MSYILHMSDFHFGRDLELEKQRLTDLATWITENNIPIKYLVFTGDMIDAPTIQVNCVKKLKKTYPTEFSELKPSSDCDIVLSYVRNAGTSYISFYNDQLRQITLRSMRQAGEFFLDFINKIKVDKSNVVLCCGNHDRIRFAGEEVFNCGENHSIDESGMAFQFEAYDNLCDIINNKLSHRTMVYSRDDINFVIANSNWKVPTQKETNHMCVSCESLSNQLSQLRQIDTFNRHCNLLIAHKPCDDFCESVKYPYAGEMLTVTQIAERTVTAFLYGDKHSYSVKMKNELKEFMCGLPLNDQDVRYNLLDFDPAVGIRSCSYILNNKGEWFKIPIMDCQDSIYNVSQPYLRDYTFELLTSAKTVPREWYSAMKIMQNAYDNKILEKVSELFASISELRQGKPSIEIEKSTLFSQFVSLIESSPLQAISIKGRPGVGKSTFTTMVYLYMLWLFSCGKTRYIPFYFNLDTIINNKSEGIHYTYNVDEYISYCFERFSDYFNRCCTLGREYKLPICLFIDGLEKSKILAPGNDTIEKRIYQLVESKLQKIEDKYVMCFNTHDSYSFQNSFEKINRFQYVLFMNAQRIIPYKAQDPKQDTFLAAYLSLNKKPADEVALQTLKKALFKFRKPSIDLFFLYHCDKHIFEIKDREEIWAVLRMHLEDLENIAGSMFGFRIDLIQQAAGLLFSQRKCYAEIIDTYDEETEKLTIAEFLSFINVPIIASYLIANHYVQELVKYSENSTATIPGDSILYSFVAHELSLLIRLILDKEGRAANSILLRFINYHGQELKGYLSSTISYLCGHIRMGDNAHLIKILPPPERDSNEFFALCYRRSYDLAVASYSTNKFPAEEIVLEFIDNEVYRKFNRSYQLHYYQDDSNNSSSNQFAWSPDVPPACGFDFRNSFLMLLSKLDPVLQGAKQSYPFMQLDLFTLCDLIYSRLQYTTPDSIFYSAKYNERNDSECEAILSRAVALLEKYNTLYGGKKSTNDRVGAYFSLMRDRFNSIVKNIKQNSGKDIDIPYVSPCYDLNQILNLSSVARVGWNIEVPGEIKVEQQPKYEMDPDTGITCPMMYESLMQHVMESVYMAQMFLPDTLLSEEGFQKSKVISLILFSELGKVGSGDYSPNYSNYNKWKKREEKELAHMSILGALDGYAVQPTFTELLASKSSIDVNMRICWEIKMIQREFKYYKLYSKLGFNDERRLEFEADFEEPTTNICRAIREQLILKNPEFKAFLIN